MIYALIGAVLTAIVFCWLFIRSAVANGQLRSTNAELLKNVDVKQKQLEIAANHLDTPLELAERMRKGTL